MLITLALLVAVLLDRWLGEPRRWHPLNGFAAVARWLEGRLYGGRLRGGLAVVLLIVPPAVLFAWLGAQGMAGWLIGITVLYIAIGWRSLIDHAVAVRRALDAADPETARRCTGYLVGRDTGAMDETQMAGATLESVLENGNDALFAAIFWFVVAGPGGVVAYRLANTLDALWGYRNDRYRDFGWAAARLDDVLNFIPARLTALGYMLCGRALHHFYRIAQQAQAWPSSNAGWVMAAGGCALQRQLGGSVSYQGVAHERPPLGTGARPEAADIGRGLRLVRNTLILWLAVIGAGAWVLTHA
ncbi:adenosylcobinamide-phosphate synthase [Methylohalomonas lacus]|uniref:Cobalamin biosynthesis protein CobD n=1 Tax=Methylohalomonas lacus TaxID=398773 RepID=A0AAE3HHZ4_9GAMM|nr:adenosylcobinamide-phosphate synthase CbiB [Methylohalomonas lacus]MCS3902691.1 adenosylcobinamide-phosphate synthase [Methylohalomonas lacus]